MRSNNQFADFKNIINKMETKSFNFRKIHDSKGIPRSSLEQSFEDELSQNKIELAQKLKLQF